MKQKIKTSGGKFRTRKVVVVFVIIGILLSVANAFVIRLTDHEVPSFEDKLLVTYPDNEVAIPTPLGIYVSGSYGDSGNCNVCLGYSTVTYYGFQVGGFGKYFYIGVE